MLINRWLSDDTECSDVSFAKLATVLVTIAIASWLLLLLRDSAVDERPILQSVVSAPEGTDQLQRVPPTERESPAEASARSLTEGTKVNQGRASAPEKKRNLESAASESPFPAMIDGGTQSREVGGAQVQREARSDGGRRGIHFPVSVSVAEGCVKHGDLRNPLMPDEPARGHEAACLKALRVLARFTEEDRAEPWASEIESHIKRSMEFVPHRCEVRNIECRSTLCIYECASLEYFNLPEQVGYMEAYGLKHYGDLVGIERDESGSLITVWFTALVKE